MPPKRKANSLSSNHVTSHAMKAKRTKQTPKGKKSETFTIKEDNITATKLLTAIWNGDINSVARLESKSTRAPTSSRTGANKLASIAQRNPASPRARQVAVTSNASINSADSGARRNELNPTAPPYTQWPLVIQIQ